MYFQIRSQIIVYLFCILQLVLFNSCGRDNPENNVLTLEELSEEFINPPSGSKPGAYWCWLNGNISRERISRDLREMSEKGVGRAEIWDVAAVNNPGNYIPAGPAFMSDSSVVMIRYAIGEAKKYNISIGMVGSSGWNAGGSWVEPEWASKALYYSSVLLEGPIKKRIELPFPEVPERCPKGSNGLPLFYKEVAVLAIPQNENRIIEDTGKIIDLSSSFEQDYINIDLPEGKWVVLRFICSNNGQKLIVPSPNSNGLFIDFLNPSSTVKHLSHIVERLGITREENANGGLGYIEFDSMELAGGIAWTDSMPDIFKKRKGYDLIKYLPVLAGWSIEDETDRFIYDWKKTISDQLIYSHYETGRRFLKDYNIELVAEAGGPGPPTWDTCPVDALKALGNVSVPRGEFWVRHRDIFLVKEIASAAHIYDKKIVDAESFTTWRRWKDSPFDLKKIVDRAFCEGLNSVTFHTFASTAPEDGLPGRTYHAGSDINHANTWWDKSGPFMDYLARCCYLLRQGIYVADVCYYYGDQAPNFYPAYHVVPEKPLLEGLGAGYDYDVVNSDVIINRMSVEEGRIVLPGGLNYSALVLPDNIHMPLEILRKLERLVRDGAIIIGNKPLSVPGLSNYINENEELSRISEQLWKERDGGIDEVNNIGKGKVITGKKVGEILMENGIERDFIHEGEHCLDYIHRQNGEYDIYFIRNKGASPYKGSCSFRVCNRIPELWDPSSGEQVHPEKFEEERGRLNVSLDLEPYASIFVLFVKDKRSVPLRNKLLPGCEKKIVILDRDWDITFPEGWGAPPGISLDSLGPWTDSDNFGIKYFSGTATYITTIKITEDNINECKRITLDLGQVCDLAEIFVNGRSAGILWKKPYVLDITQFVKEGINRIEIDVVNQWVNRLVGDMLSSPDNRFCYTNQPYITSDDMGYDNWIGTSDETYRLKTSGLVGPVRLIFW